MVARSYTTFFESSSISSTSADASADVVYTIPANHDAELTFLSASNGSATNNISIQIFHADDSTYTHILRSHSVGGNDSYKVIDADIVYLHAGDKVLAYKGSGTFDVSVSGKLYYNPSRSN